MIIKKIEELYNKSDLAKEVISYLFLGNFSEDFISANKEEIYFNHCIYHYKRKILQIERVDFSDTEGKVDFFLDILANDKIFKEIIEEILSVAQSIQDKIDSELYTNKNKLLEDKIKIVSLKSVVNDLVNLTDREINIKL